MNLKKIIALVLCVCMVLSFFPVSVFAEEWDEEIVLTDEEYYEEPQEEYVEEIIEEEPTDYVEYVEPVEEIVVEETVEEPVVEELAPAEDAVIVEETAPAGEAVAEQPAADTAVAAEPKDDAALAVSNAAAFNQPVGGNITEAVAKVVHTNGDPDDYYETLQAAFDAASTAGEDVTVEILEDVNLNGVNWVPVSINANTNGMHVTVQGGNHTITNLSAPLFASTWAGNTGLAIFNLTIADSNVIYDENDTAGDIGVGAFVGWPQASAEIILNNCHLLSSTVKGGHWTGGLIGIAAGYNGNDGPVFEQVFITNCSVENSNIIGPGAAGAIIGHACSSAWTKVVITGTTVTGNTIEGENDEKTGILIGTAGTGKQATTNGVTCIGGVWIQATESGNTLNKGQYEIGRIGSTGGTAFFIEGGSYTRNPLAISDPAKGTIAAETGYVAKRSTDDTWTIGLPDPVAQIGETKYATLAKAIAEAQSGETITLLADVDASAVIEIKKSITIDGGGYKLNTTANRGIWIAESNVDVTIKNLEIVPGTATERAIQVNSNMEDVKLTLVNVTASATMYTVNVCNGVNNLELNISGCNLTGWGVVNLWAANGKATITNSVLTGINDKSYDADGWNGFGVVVLEGDTTGQTDMHANAWTVTLEDTTIITQSTTGNKQRAILFNKPNVSNSVAMKDCHVVLDNENCLFQLDQGTGNTLTLDNVTVNTAATGNLPSGYTVVPNDDDGYNIVQFAAVEADAATTTSNGQTTSTVDITTKDENNNEISTKQITVTYAGEKAAVIDSSGGSTTVIDAATVNADTLSEVIAKKVEAFVEYGYSVDNVESSIELLATAVQSTEVDVNLAFKIEAVMNVDAGNARMTQTLTNSDFPEGTTHTFRLPVGDTYNEGTEIKVCHTGRDNKPDEFFYPIVQKVGNVKFVDVTVYDFSQLLLSVPAGSETQGPNDKVELTKSNGQKLYFETISDALAEADNGSTVKLVGLPQGETEWNSINVNTSKTIKLHLGDYPVNGIAVNGNANVTVIGAGTLGGLINVMFGSLTIDSIGVTLDDPNVSVDDTFVIKAAKIANADTYQAKLEGYRYTTSKYVEHLGEHYVTPQNSITYVLETDATNPETNPTSYNLYDTGVPIAPAVWNVAKVKNFAGWALNENTIITNTNELLGGDVTLYATWTDYVAPVARVEGVNVNFSQEFTTLHDAYNCSAVTNATVTIIGKEVNEGQDPIAVTVTKSWPLSVAADVIPASYAITVADNVTLKSKLDATYTVNGTLIYGSTSAPTLTTLSTGKWAWALDGDMDNGFTAGKANSDEIGLPLADGYIWVENTSAGYYEIQVNNNVASVNGVYYTDFGAAIVAANATNKPIKLEKNVAYNGNIDYEVTIDLNNHNLSAAENGAVNINANVTITRVNGGDVNLNGFTVAANKTLIIEDAEGRVKVPATINTVGIAGYDGASIKYKENNTGATVVFEWKVDHWARTDAVAYFVNEGVYCDYLHLSAAVNNAPAGGTVYLIDEDLGDVPAVAVDKDLTLVLEDDGKFGTNRSLYGINVTNSATLTIKGHKGTLSGVASENSMPIRIQSGKVYVEGGIISGNGGAFNVTRTGELHIERLPITEGENIGTKQNLAVIQSNIVGAGTKVITSGTFGIGTNIAGLLPDGYALTTPSNNNNVVELARGDYYDVVPAVAMVGENYYDTVQSAVNAAATLAEGPRTVKLFTLPEFAIENEPVNYTGINQVTIDLNGNNWANTEAYTVVGDLKFEDSTTDKASWGLFTGTLGDGVTVFSGNYNPKPLNIEQGRYARAVKDSAGTTQYYSVIGENEIVYTVTFSANDGTSATATQTFDFQTAAEIKLNKNTFTRADYAFTGWATTEVGDVKFADEYSVKASDLAPLAEDGSVTLYAHWNEAVAKVNGVPFDKLQNAIKYAEAIDDDQIKPVVEIFKDFTETTDSEVAGEIILDLKGHTVTLNNKYLTVKANGNLTIQDTVAEGADPGVLNVRTVQNSGGTLTVIGGKINGVSNAILNTGGTLTISGGDVKGYNGVSVTGGTATISGGSFSASPGFSLTKSVGGTVTITGGTFEKDVTSANENMTISGGKFAGAVSEYATISGGLFAIKPADTQLATNANHSLNVGNDKVDYPYRVITSPVALIQKDKEAAIAYFETVQDAFTAVGTHAEANTVRLTTDIADETVVYEGAKDVTFRMNAHNWTNTDAEKTPVFTNRSENTISFVSYPDNTISANGYVFKAESGSFSLGSLHYLSTAENKEALQSNVEGGIILSNGVIVSGADPKTVDNVTLAKAKFGTVKLEDGLYKVVETETGVVASIGTTNYADLQAALNDAAADDTVVLKQDVDGSFEVKDTNTASFTLDLNGKTITGRDQATLKHNGSGTLTITGEGKVTNDNTNAENGMVIWARRGSVVIENGTFESNNGYEATIYISKPADAEDHTVTINGGTFTNSAAADNYDMRLPGLILNVSNGLSSDKDWFVVNGGTFKQYNPAWGDDVLSIETGKTFLGENKVSVYDVSDPSVTPAPFVVKSETAEGVVAATVLVSDQDATYPRTLSYSFENFDDALTFANGVTVNPELQPDATITIKLEKNVEADVAVAITRDMTLDLNEKNIEATGDHTANTNPGFITINNNAVLTISGEGDIGSNYYLGTINVIKGELVLNGGTILGETLSDKVNNGISVRKDGKLTIGDEAEVSVEGGRYAILNNGGEVAIAAGTYKGVNKAYNVTSNSNGKSNITGGVFYSDPTEYLTDGYIAVKGTDEADADIWTVVSSVKVTLHVLNKETETEYAATTVNFVPAFTTLIPGYTFDGWYKDAEFATAYPNDGEILTVNTDLYGKWTENQYTVKFNANGATGTMDPLTGKKVTDTVDLTNTYTNQYKYFHAWNTVETPTEENPGHVIPGASETPMADLIAYADRSNVINIYAQWGDAVAKVGDEYYATLAAAIEAAEKVEEGPGVVQICAATVTEDNALTVKGNVVFDLMGSKVDIGKNTITVASGAVLTIQDTPADDDAGVLNVQTVQNNGGTLTVTGGKINGVSNAILNTGGTLTISGGDIKGYNGVSVTGGTATIIGGSFSASPGVSLTKSIGGTVTISGGTFEKGVTTSNKNLTISGGKFKGAFDGEMSISGGVFSTAPSAEQLSTDPKVYLALNTDEGGIGDGYLFTVITDAVAMVPVTVGATTYDIHFKDLKNAVVAATDLEEKDVTLVNNAVLTESVEIAANSKLGINLNGHNIAAATDAAEGIGIVVNGELAILDFDRGVTDYGTVAVPITVNGGGTLISAKNQNVLNRATISGDVTVSGTQTNPATFIDNYSGVSYNTATVTLGEYSVSPILTFRGTGTLTVNGGNIEEVVVGDKDSTFVMTKGDIYDLDIRNSKSIAISGEDTYVTGNKLVLRVNGAPAQGAITGGYFNLDPKDYVATGKSVTSKGSDKYQKYMWYVGNCTHTDVGDVYICPYCGEVLKADVVLWSSTGTAQNDSIAKLTKSSSFIKDGTSVTLTAPDKDPLGYEFVGWFMMGDDITKEALSSEKTYTFNEISDKVEFANEKASVTYVAVYKAVGSFTLNVTAPIFKVQVGSASAATSYGTFTRTYTAGTEVTITWIGSNDLKFDSWVNGSGQQVSDDTTFTYTMNHNVDITAIFSQATVTTSQAKLVFYNASGFVKYAQDYTADETIDFPSAPYKGDNERFTGWFMTTDAGEVEATQESISAWIANENRDVDIIEITPKFEAEEIAANIRTATVVNNVVSEFKPVEAKVGKSVTITAEATITEDGTEYKFVKWADNAEGNGAVSTEKSFSFIVNTEAQITFYAFYDREAVDPVPAVSLIIQTPVLNPETGKTRTTFAATRVVPEGYTVVQSGVLYYWDYAGGVNEAEAKLKVENIANIKSGISDSTESSGTVTVSSNTSAAERTYFAVGFVTTEKDGNTTTTYTPVQSVHFPNA